MLGFDLSIKKTWLVTDDEQRSNSFYFYAPSKQVQPFKQSHDCFVYSAQILTDEDWSKILACTFNNKMSHSISVFWVRLVSMFSYKGFWEYEILGVVSLLDAYSKDYHKIHTNKRMPVRRFRKLKDRMKSVLYECKNELPLDEESSGLCEVIDNMMLQVGYIKNTNAQDFREVLSLLMGSVNDNIRALVDFKDVDFEMIIKIRNLAAHGLPIDEDIMGEIQRVMIVKEKIKFLMLYFFFTSIGFSDDGFIKLCRHSFNKIKLGASLNSYILNVVYGSGSSFDIDAVTLSKAKGQSSFNIGMVFHVKSETYDVNEQGLNEIIGSVFTVNRGEYTNVIDLIYSEYIHDRIFSVEYLHSAFLCHADEIVEIHGLYLIRVND